MDRLPENAGVNKLKAKRRDIQRVLKKPGLSMEKKTTMERALKMLETDLENALKRNQTKKVAQKYHMVKFFERQKAVRALRKSKATDKELADFYYVHNYPKDQKYSALFVENAVGRESEFYKSVLAQMKANTLEKGPEGIKNALEALKSEAEETKRAREAKEHEAAERKKHREKREKRKERKREQMRKDKEGEGASAEGAQAQEDSPASGSDSE